MQKQSFSRWGNYRKHLGYFLLPDFRYLIQALIICSLWSSVPTLCSYKTNPGEIFLHIVSQCNWERNEEVFRPPVCSKLLKMCRWLPKLCMVRDKMHLNLISICNMYKSKDKYDQCGNTGPPRSKYFCLQRLSKFQPGTCLASSWCFPHSTVNPVNIPSPAFQHW